MKGFFLEKREVLLGIKCGFPSPLEVFKKVVKKVFKTVRTNRCDFEPLYERTCILM